MRTALVKKQFRQVLHALFIASETFQETDGFAVAADA